MPTSACRTFVDVNRHGDLDLRQEGTIPDGKSLNLKFRGNLPFILNELRSAPQPYHFKGFGSAEQDLFLRDSRYPSIPTLMVGPVTQTNNAITKTVYGVASEAERLSQDADCSFSSPRRYIYSRKKFSKIYFVESQIYTVRGVQRAKNHVEMLRFDEMALNPLTRSRSVFSKSNLTYKK